MGIKVFLPLEIKLTQKSPSPTFCYHVAGCVSIFYGECLLLASDQNKAAAVNTKQSIFDITMLYAQSKESSSLSVYMCVRYQWGGKGAQPADRVNMSVSRDRTRACHSRCVYISCLMM